MRKGARGGGHGSGARDDAGAARPHLDDEVDGLFRLGLPEFTAARNTLAARLKKAGRGDDADAVKALVKPSVSAWAVNQVYWAHRQAFDQLLATGARFSDAQLSHLSGGAADLRESLDARRRTLSEASRLAGDVLRAAGHPATPEMMRRIVTTLEALSTGHPSPDAPRPGRLVDDVDPPGFEALAPLISQMGDSARRDGPTRVLRFRAPPRSGRGRKGARSTEGSTGVEEEARQAARAAAQAAVAQCEREAQDAQAAVGRAEVALKKAAMLAKESEKEKLRLEQQLASAAAAAEAAHQEAHRVAADAEAAAQTLDEAERALDRARAALHELA